MCVWFRGVWPVAPRGLLGRRRRVDCVAGGAAWTVWPMVPRGLLGLGALLNAHRSIGWTLVV